MGVTVRDRPERPDELPPDAVVTAVGVDGFACKWCENSADMWVRTFPAEGETLLRAWCASCFNDACPPFGDATPTMDDRQIRGENAPDRRRNLNEWIETATKATDTGGIVAPVLYERYESFCEEREAEAVSEPSWLGRMCAAHRIELEGDSDESEAVLGGLYLRGVVPA